MRFDPSLSLRFRRKDHERNTLAYLKSQRLKATEAAAAALQLQHQQRLEEENARRFRFMDLPLELRKIVYSYYATNIERLFKAPTTRSFWGTVEPRRQLAHLPIPALAHVCQKIRSEFMEIFFKEGKFVLVIGPCAPRPARPGSHTGRWDHFVEGWFSEALLNRIKSTQDPADPIYLSRYMADLLNPMMVVRDVKFSLHDLNFRYIEEAQNRQGQYLEPRGNSGRERLALWLRWEGGRLNVLESSPKYMPRSAEIFAHSICEARKISEGDEFKGFTVEDLRWIASVILANTY